MNILIIILNRVYYFLTKVKNPYPFFGALILVALLINSLLNNLVTFIYLLNDKPNKINEIAYFSILLVIFLLVYFYASKRKIQIVETRINSAHKLNLLVAGIFLFTLFSFIWFANVNREKLSKEKPDAIVKPQKESLEGKIRKLFE